MAEKLVLIDGNSILYRAFFALPPLALPDGRYTNAVYGFANMIVKTIQDIQPSHMVVAFDVSKHTFRNDIFSEYKATRKPMPNELRSQIEPVKELLRKMNIKILEKEGLEADDVLGTITKRFSDKECIIVTGDRDTLQLISDKTKIYFTKKGLTDIKVMGLDEFHEEYGIEPEGIVDLKAFQGDTADNIPGAQGVGPKTALELIQNYKTVENVYEHLDELKTGVKNKLEASKDNVYMSKKLAKINRDVDIECEFSELKFDYPFNEDVYDFMIYYKFNSLLKRKELFQDFSTEEKVIQFQTEKIDNNEKLFDMIKSIEKNGFFSFFISDDNDIYFATKDEEWFIEYNQDLLSTLSYNKLFDFVKPIFENESIRKIFFDSKAVRHILFRNGVEVKGKCDDVSILSHLVEGVSIKKVEDVLNNVNYSIKTPAMSLFLAYQDYLVKLKDLNMEDLYNNVEVPLSKVLFEMEQVGFKVDLERLESLGNQYKKEIDDLVEKIHKVAGEEFNINSPKQLAEILFNKLGLPHNKKLSTNVEILQEIEQSHEIIPLILRYRKVSKIYSTYIEGLKPHIDKNNFVHTCFKQTLTNTGRLSSVEPNLQNIPIRSEESREVRSIYVASSENNVLIDADYSQIELRLLAHFSEDEFFVNAFKNNLDIHTQTASQVFGVSLDSVTSEMRRVAKVVNFGIIYGISDFGLANDLKTTPKEARVLIDNFYNSHPKVREYMDVAVKKARETGRVETLLGRTRRMVDINASNYMVRSRAERASQNMPLQGSASDVIKLAMIKVRNSLKNKGYKAKLIMQVHDELLIDSPKDEVESVKMLLKECMNTAYELKVPLVCDITESYRWSDGH